MSRTRNRQPNLSAAAIRRRVDQKLGATGVPMIRLTPADLRHLSGVTAPTWKTLYAIGVVRAGEWPPPKGWRKALTEQDVWVGRDAWTRATGASRVTTD